MFGRSSRRIAASVAVLSVAAAMVIAGADQLTAAFSSTRSISLYNIHTKETLTIEYKRKGEYVPEAMDKINWILRDWRRNEKTTMDPMTIDILWEMHTELGSKEPINVISGFRSRTTNDMLRRTVGGQASESQHTTGKAVDVTFPDVPLKNIRYAAMIREQGGVGYYPTSGIPFVHVDTGRVRAWPRLPRYELALLFPNGSSKHAPADGGSLSSEDVKVAQSRYKDLAVQIAAFFDLRKSGQDAAGSKPAVLLADAARPSPKSQPSGELRVASLGPAPVGSAPLRPQSPVAGAALKSQPVTATQPRLLVEPKLVERPSRLVPSPTESDRTGLDALVELASAVSTDTAPKLLIGPTPAVRRNSASAPRASLPEKNAAPIPAGGETLAAAHISEGKPRTSWMQLASLDTSPSGDPTEKLTGDNRVMSDAVPPGWSNGYAAAPAFDEEHPEELHYRPFPISPLLTETPSINEPAIARIVAPDVVKIMQLLDQPTAVLPMQFRPGRQIAETMWAQQFQGEPVQLADSSFGDGAEEFPTQLIPRGVKTTPQQ